MPVSRGTLNRGPLKFVSSTFPTGVNVKPSSRRPSAPAGHVAFATAQPPLSVVCKLGAESATPGGGVGGWQALELPGREDATEWGSTPGRTLSVPILLDGFVARRSVEADIAALYEMGCPPEGAKRGTPPPVVRIGGMVPGTSREWVIQGIEEGAATWDGMRRIRLFATVALSEHKPPELVVVRRAKSSSTAASSTRTYTVKRGDTLASIARDEMGANSASEIAKAVRALKEANKIRDPKSIKPGDKLKIPGHTDTVGAKTPA